MRFGGHETFPVRDGWLHKGMALISADPDAFADPLVSDRLGVGRNMAKSIRHWLLATGLAESERADTDPKRRKLVPSEVGTIVFARDPYFVQLGTWCALHFNMLNASRHAEVWTWFFGRYPEQRFDRLGCLAALERFVERGERHRAARRTLQRDIACLLGSYACPIPSELADPEDAADSPFRRLGLLSHFPDSHSYRRNEADIEQVGPELLGYGLAVCGPAGPSVPLRDACYREGGPGKALHLGLDALMDFLERAEQDITGKPIRIMGSAGERRIACRALPPAAWLDCYYDRMAEPGAAA